MLRNSTFWIGVVLAPVPWFILLSIGGFTFRQMKAIREWYIGLPITQWFGMWCIVIGCKIVKQKKYCYFMPYEGRFWLSPNVGGFKIPDETEKE